MPATRKPIFLMTVAAFCLLAAVPDCDAAVTLSARFGWGDRFRPDRWTPAYVVAQADAPTAAVIEWYVPRPGREAMVIRQSVTLNPGGSTFPAYLPVGPDPAAIHVRVADAADGRTLAAWPARPPSPTAYDDAQVRTNVFVGTSGAAPSMRFLDAATFTAAYLPPRDLPRRGVGYDGLDVLVLDRPDLNALEPAQQRAVAAWVRAGGSLVIWLGINPVPPDAPLAPLLPGRVVDFTTRTVDGKESPFVRLEGVADDALVTGVARGAGRVIFLHAPPDVLHAAGVAFVPDQPRPTPTLPPIDPAAVKAAAPPAPRPAWFLPALGVAALIGPIDWLVMRRTRRRGRPWATVPGWLGLFALLALYLPSQRRTAAVVRTSVVEADGRTVAAVARRVGGGEPLDAVDGSAVDELNAVGLVYPRTLGFDRLTGPTRDLIFPQGDEGMSFPADPVNADAVALPH